jgi:hypothetical protein
MSTVVGDVEDRFESYTNIHDVYSVNTSQEDTSEYSMPHDHDIAAMYDHFDTFDAYFGQYGHDDPSQTAGMEWAPYGYEMNRDDLHGPLDFDKDYTKMPVSLKQYKPYNFNVENRVLDGSSLNPSNTYMPYTDEVMEL